MEPITARLLLQRALDQVKAENEANPDDHNEAVARRIKQADDLLVERDRQHAARQTAKPIQHTGIPGEAVAMTRQPDGSFIGELPTSTVKKTRKQR